jgi:hypothetical protein
MKKAIIVRGPQGSGKSTYILSKIKIANAVKVNTPENIKHVFQTNSVIWFDDMDPNKVISLLYEKPATIRFPYSKELVVAVLPEKIYIETSKPLEQINLCALLYLGYNIKLKQF